MASLSIFATILFLYSLNLTHASSITANAGVFNITNFINGGAPHGLFARIAFQVSSSTCPDSATLNNVECFYQQSIQPTIAFTTVSVPCYNHSVSFDFTYASESVGAEGFYLRIAHVYGNNKTVDVGQLYMGRHKENVVDPLNPNGDYQRLVHDKDFSLGFNRAEDDCC